MQALQSKIIRKQFFLLSSSGFPIAADVEFPYRGESLPCILLLHGFKGFKDWGFFPILSQRFAQAGAIAVRFNFSLNGMAEGSDRVAYPDRFAQNTITQELEDADTVFRFLFSTEFQTMTEGKWDGERCFLFGHSRGGGIGLLLLQRRAEIQRGVFWAPVSTFHRYTERQVRVWKEQGYLEVQNTRTGQKLKIYRSYIDDLEEHQEEYDLQKVISQVTKPILLIYGSEDLSVPPREGKILYDHSNKDMVRYIVIPRTGHTFGVRHPFSGTTEAFEHAVKYTLQWFSLSE